MMGTAVSAVLSIMTRPIHGLVLSSNANLHQEN